MGMWERHPCPPPQQPPYPAGLHVPPLLCNHPQAGIPLQISRGSYFRRLGLPSIGRLRVLAPDIPPRYRAPHLPTCRLCRREQTKQLNDLSTSWRHPGRRQGPVERVEYIVEELPYMYRMYFSKMHIYINRRTKYTFGRTHT